LGTHVIIDARTAKVRASLDAPGDGATIFAIDLIGDTRYDTEQARVLERIDDLTNRNRYVRAATAALFSHLDGVVSDVFTIRREEGSFAAYRPKNPRRCSIKRKNVYRTIRTCLK
jgi:hypothetical protein